MKRLTSLTIFLLVAICAAHAGSPAKGFTNIEKNISESKHALEISTGYPSMHFIHTILIDLPNVIAEEAQGIRRSREYTACLNLGYSYSYKKRWEFAPMLNVFILGHVKNTYRQHTDTDGNSYYNWEEEPVSSRKTSQVGASLDFSARIKWLVRDNLSLYSAFGLSISTTIWFPYPYLAPFGIKFGGKRVYGIVELGVSQSTVGTIGIGIRL